MRPFGPLLVGLTAWIGFLGVGSEAAEILHPAGTALESDRFRFRLTAPSPSFAPSSDGYVHVRIEGFDVAERRPGAPDLPTRTILLAIPAGTVPRLTIHGASESTRPGLRPRPVPTVRHTVPARAARARIEGVPGAIRPDDVQRVELLTESRQAYAADVHPEAALWLGETGVFRDQRYVELRFAPVRWDPSIEGLRITRELEAEVVFVGALPQTGPRAPASPFEDVYRRTFANYAQGRAFRLQSAAPLALPQGGGGESDAAGPRRKILVRGNGVVLLDDTLMTGTGFETEPLSTWKLVSGGEEVPLQLHDVNANDLLDPGDRVLFYGQALDFEPKTALNTDTSGSDLFEARDFDDQNVYMLQVESGQRLRMATLDGTPPPPGGEPTQFTDTAHEEEDSAFRPLGGADPWYWAPTLMSDGSPPYREISVPLPGLVSGTEPVQVRVHLRGITEDHGLDPDHKTRITLMNAADEVLATHDDDGTFDGRTLYLHDFGWTWPGSGPQLTDPAKVKVELLSNGGDPHDVIVDWVEIDYQRSFAASGDSLRVAWPDGDATLQVSGMTSGAGAVEVYELTGEIGQSGLRDPVRLTGIDVSGPGPSTVRFRIDDTGQGGIRRFLVAGSGATTVPAAPDFSSDVQSDLLQNGNQADLIVIGPQDLLNEIPGGPLDQLINLRASQGISTKVAHLEDVEDDFNDGRTGPLAIRNFLAYVMSTAPGEGWADPRPAYLLLIGDGSFDYKGGRPKGNYLPTQLMFKDDPSLGYYASDNVLAAVLGDDQLPELAVGRLSARTQGEADALLQRVVDYEQAPPGGSWTRHALFVSDRGKNVGGSPDPIESEQFEMINDLGEAEMKLPPHTSKKLRYWSDYVLPGVPNPDTTIKQDIKDNVNGVCSGCPDGVSIMQFIGHGNFDLWSDDVIFCGNEGSSFCPNDDTDDLTNGGRLPWLMVHNCLTGGFHTDQPKTFGEAWLQQVGGGSLAVYAPSGLGFRFLGEKVTEEIWNEFYGPTKQRLVANAVMRNLTALCGQGSIEGCQFYVLLGDPTTTLQFPTVDPASAVTASGGNAVVDLSWTASNTPLATHDVYRSIAPSSGYTLIQSGVSGNAYQDSGVANATTYYYYVVALDPDGFESRWSNFNSDCGAAMPTDCVVATPLNPDPPAVPQDVVAVDTESGGRLDVSWTANTENDFDFYTVHYGVQSGQYDTSVDTFAPFVTLGGLDNGTTYYIAVTATNTSDKTSGFSTEQVATPTLVRGVKSPAFVQDLVLSRAGDDIVLDWTAVDTDIYGKTETVDRYEVYRGTSPGFTIDEGTLISPPTLTAPTFTDVGAALGSAPDYYYLVRAVDVDGNPGGLGRQLPDGIDDLRLAPSSITPGDLVLSWSAVETVFVPGSQPGGPTIVEAYEVYADSAPFTRADIRDGSVPLLQTTSATSVELTPAVGDRYYSVIAVDNRGNKSPF